MLKYGIIWHVDDNAALTRCLRALSEPARRQVVELLSAGALRAGEIASLTGLSPATMSRHLRALLSAGLVDDERSVTDARVRLFFLQREALEPLEEWLERFVSSGRRRPAAGRADP